MLCRGYCSASMRDEDDGGEARYEPYRLKLQLSRVVTSTIGVTKRHSNLVRSWNHPYIHDNIHPTPLCDQHQANSYCVSFTITLSTSSHRWSQRLASHKNSSWWYAIVCSGLCIFLCSSVSGLLALVCRLKSCIL